MFNKNIFSTLRLFDKIKIILISTPSVVTYLFVTALFLFYFRYYWLFFILLFFLLILFIKFTIFSYKYLHRIYCGFKKQYYQYDTLNSQNKFIISLIKFLSKNSFKIVLYFKYIILFLLPIVLNFYLYQPTKRIVFNGKNYQQTELKIENLFQKEPSTRNLFTGLFSVPLHLDWYKVSIINNSIIGNNDCLIPEPTTVFFSFLKGDPRKYLTDMKETTEATGGYSTSGPGHPHYYLHSGERAFFIAPSWEDYSINGGLMFGGCKSVKSGGNDRDLDFGSFDYNITIQPYWKSWVIQLFIIYILWSFMLSSFITILDWLNRDKKRS